MARIELNKTPVRFVDGYSATAAVNDTLADGDTTMSIDTYVIGRSDAGTLVPVSARFSVVGSDEWKYTVTDANADSIQTSTIHSGTTSGTYTLTFKGVFGSATNEATSALAYNANSSAIQTALEALASILPGDVVVTGDGSVGNATTIEFTGQYKDVKMATITGQDVDLMGTGHAVTIAVVEQGGTTHDITFTPAISSAEGVPSNNAVITFTGRTLEVKLGDGDITWDENRPRKYTNDRGLLDDVRDDDQVPMDVNCDSVWEESRSLAGATTPTIEEACKQVGAAADWVSSDSDFCKPYSVDIEIEEHKSCGEFLEITTLSVFRYEKVSHSLKDATAKFTGKCNVTQATVERIS